MPVGAICHVTAVNYSGENKRLEVMLTDLGKGREGEPRNFPEQFFVVGGEGAKEIAAIALTALNLGTQAWATMEGYEAYSYLINLAVTSNTEIPS